MLEKIIMYIFYYDIKGKQKAKEIISNVLFGVKCFAITTEYLIIKKKTT